MKSKMFKSAKYAALLMVMLLIGYSCSDDPPEQQFIETQWFRDVITVENNMWGWNEEANRHEVFFDLPELTKFIYEEGVLDAYVFLGQEGVNEVQKKLPFVRTYPETDVLGNPILDEDGNFKDIYTETISCDFQVVPSSSVAFYIQGSDLKKYEGSPGEYTFRILLVW